MSAFAKCYQKILSRFPIMVQALQAGALMGTGDLIAQAVVERKSFKEISLIRTGQFTIVGTFIVGPSLSLWYGVLDRYIGSTGKYFALKKVALDQICFAPFFLGIVLTAIGIIQGNKLDQVQRKVSHDYPDVLKNNYKLWPAVQLVNFYIVPLQYQVVTVQFVAIFWNMYISWKANQVSYLRAGK